MMKKITEIIIIGFFLLMVFGGFYVNSKDNVDDYYEFIMLLDEYQLEIGVDCVAGQCVTGVSDDGTLICSACSGGSGNTTEEIFTVCNNGTFLTTETDPIYSAWDKDYNDLINTPYYINNSFNNSYVTYVGATQDLQLGDNGIYINDSVIEISTTKFSPIILTRYTSSLASSTFSFNKANGDADNPVGLTSNDAIGQFNFGGHNGTSFKTLAKVRGDVGSGSGATIDGELRFYTADNSQSLTEAIHIDSDQNVCIGCTDVEGNRTKIDGTLRVVDDVIIEGTLHGGSPLMISNDVCIKDHVTGEWVSCGSYNHEYQCLPNDYCEMKDVVLQDKHENPDKYRVCSYSLDEDGSKSKVCNSVDINQDNMEYYYDRVSK